MDFEKHLRNGVNLIKEEPLFFVLGGGIVLFLNLLSLGLLAGPLLAPYMLTMILMLRHNQRPQFNDLQNGLSRFGLLFPFIITEILIVIGFFLLVIPGLVLMTWWLFVLPLMADQGLTWNQAMRVSRQKVMEKGFLLHLVFVFLISVVPTMLINIAAVHFGILKILQLLLLPFQFGCITSLYLEHFDAADANVGGTSFAAEEQSPPESPPPPPLEN